MKKPETILEKNPSNPNFLRRL